MSQAEKYFREYQGAIAISSRKCTTYKLDIEAKNPPTFSDNFKAAIQKLHDLTMETKEYRLTVVKTGLRAFNTTLNSTSERKFDSAFSDFVRYPSPF